jgi:hypothetical protein
LIAATASRGAKGAHSPRWRAYSGAKSKNKETLEHDPKSGPVFRKIMLKQLLRRNDGADKVILP